MADERFPGTTQGDMVPVQEQDANAIKRVFRVKKQRRELFGWKLIPIDKSLYVAHVEERNVEFEMTAAYRSGVKFGDKITHVNGNVITSKTDTYALDLELEDCLEVQIDMVETPLFHRQSVDVVNTWDEIGLSYENGFITGVKEDSPAAIAKLPLEETIIQVNNTSALAMTDDQVKELVANAAAGSKHMGRNHFLLVTMKRDYASKMVENLKILMMTEKHKYRSVSAYVDATLAFDPHRGSKDMIERIQYKEKSNSDNKAKTMLRTLTAKASSSKTLHLGSGTFDKTQDVVLTPRRSIRPDDEDDDKAQTNWDYMAESHRNPKGKMPRFVVDETLHGTIRTKELRFRQGREEVTINVVPELSSEAVP